MPPSITSSGSFRSLGKCLHHTSEQGAWQVGHMCRQTALLQTALREACVPTPVIKGHAQRRWAGQHLAGMHEVGSEAFVP